MRLPEPADLGKALQVNTQLNRGEGREQIERAESKRARECKQCKPDPFH